MRVLITGGYGFIGSFVAERFHKEGHQIYIIDNLSTGNPDNLQIPHKFYRLNVEDNKCEELFKSHKFDLVIHLAAQINVVHSLENPYLDTKSNVLGLASMLQLSEKYKVKKFIFASSAAVYGMNDNAPLLEAEACDPMSPYGINKWVGELYCRKWKEIYDLQTLCLRFSNVYGPRQGTVGEGGVVSIFMERAMNNQELHVFGDGEQSRDFIYVEDLADAIYRASESDITGVYNLSTNTETTVNRLIEILDKLQPLVGVHYRPSRPGDIVRSSLDNTRIKRALDWVPMYTIEEGINKTFRWFSATRQEKKKPNNRKQFTRLKKIAKKVLPYVENVTAFAITAALSWGTKDHLYTSMLDYKMIYIILMGVMYGTRQSILSILGASGLYVGLSLADGREWISMFYDTDVLSQIAIYIFVGVIVGYAIDRKNREVIHKETEMQLVQEKYDFLNEVYTETRLVKDQLQTQIINTEDSFGKMHAIAKELDSLEPEDVLHGALTVLERVMKTDEISIYVLDKKTSYLRLMTKSTKLEFELPNSLSLKEQPILDDIIMNKTMHVNRNLDPLLPLYIAPIQCDNEVVALVSIHKMPYEQFTLFYQNMFQVAAELISDSLTRSYRYVKAAYPQRYFEGTSVLKPEHFEKILEVKRLAKSKGRNEFTLLRVRYSRGQTRLQWNRMLSAIRTTDYAGLNLNGEVCIILSNTEEQDSYKVIDRLKAAGIEATIVREEGEALYA
ncbi:NAD-dependent epimerase/dehydratase family protein [Gorillibacterium sp. sgz5001074]|uniref:NAD-dependent epimerase/dehydratase family protein n=1 Tax=Gorillibacterium sp. sgz5001074 TaxID=3446695 RepID=UPI003F67AE76